MDQVLQAKMLKAMATQLDAEFEQSMLGTLYTAPISDASLDPMAYKSTLQQALNAMNPDLIVLVSLDIYASSEYFVVDQKAFDMGQLLMFNQSPPNVICGPLGLIRLAREVRRDGGTIRRIRKQRRMALYVVSYPRPNRCKDNDDARYGIHTLR